MLSVHQLEFWDQNGYLVLSDFYSEKEIENLIKYTNEIENLKEEIGKWMIYHEKSVLDGSKLLGRIECFLDFHEQYRDFILSERLTDLLSALFGCDAILFKEKINFKLAGSNGYPPHQDAPAWENFAPERFVSTFIAVDKAIIENSCMYILPQRHKEGLIPTEEFETDKNWIPIEMNPGDILLFDAYTPHKSAANLSIHPRRTLILTHNPKQSGLHRDQYFSIKRLHFPPEIERTGAVNHQNNPFNYFNPFQ